MKLFLCLLVCLQYVVATCAKTCDLQTNCAASAFVTRKIIGCPGDSMLRRSVTLICPLSLYAVGATRVSWSFSSIANSGLLNISSDPRLAIEQNGFHLVLTNVNGDYEGSYSCQAHYSNGRATAQLNAGCVFVAGRAFFKTCSNVVCDTTIQLQEEAKGSVEFDARVEYRHGGSCGFDQAVRLMFLNKIHDSGTTESVFVCSNLGGYGSKPCFNNSRVSISFQGDDKYDLKLRLHNLTEADSGRYQIKVDLDDVVGGRRTTIIKNFDVDVTALSSLPTFPVDSTAPTTVCSTGAQPLLLLNGSVLANDSATTFDAIGGSRAGALLCVSDNISNNTAEFLYPNGAPIEESTLGLHVSWESRIIRLNRGEAATFQEGSYCCSVRSPDGVVEKSCVKISNNF